MVYVDPAYIGKGLKVILKVDEMCWAAGAVRKSNRVGCDGRPLPWVEDAFNGEVVGFVFVRRTHQTFRRLLALLEAAQIPSRSLDYRYLVGLLRLSGAKSAFSEKVSVTKFGAEVFDAAGPHQALDS